jgi:hypothetical protein
MRESAGAPNSTGASSHCPYSPSCLEVEFCELRLDVVLRSCAKNPFVIYRPLVKGHEKNRVTQSNPEASSLCANNPPGGIARRWGPVCDAS